MKIAKIMRKRKAVSPILAAILLIGLAVAAGAVLFVIVLPMIQSTGELGFSSIKFSDTDTSGVNDKVVFTLTNEESKVVSITAITVQAYNGTTWDPVNGSSTTTTFPFNIGVSQSEIDITYTFTDPSASYTKLRIKVDYKIGDDVQDPLISAEYDV
ncbi:MAG: archaellin/type IV pilin N-terminal domain-containing protein [Candidatus Hodarchaeota archaeon]